MPFYGDAQAAIHHERFGDLAYEAASAVVSILQRRGLTEGTITDLGCGSGILAAAVTAAGYQAVGVDLSPDMVELARATAPVATIVCESVFDAEIPPSVAVTATGEVLNYAADDRAGLDALREVAEHVHAALVPGGVFVFDVATPGRNFGLEVRQVFHDTPSWALGMRAQEAGPRLDRHITIFARGDDERYERVDEHHILRLYEPVDLERLLVGQGFEVELWSRYTAEPSSSTPPSGWCVVVATKPG